MVHHTSLQRQTLHLFSHRCLLSTSHSTQTFCSLLTILHSTWVSAPQLILYINCTSPSNSIWAPHSTTHTAPALFLTLHPAHTSCSCSLLPRTLLLTWLSSSLGSELHQGWSSPSLSGILRSNGWLLSCMTYQDMDLYEFQLPLKHVGKAVVRVGSVIVS